MPMISYAQNHEDVILARAFPGGSGFYVDVGAAHPVGHSVTKWFYSQGWSGINFEPLPHFFKMITEDRPRDINLNMVASDSDGECTLFEVPDCCGTSTVNPALADQIALGGATLVPHKVQARTLRNICREFVGDRTIDFLKIDAEGHERAVLNGMDFKTWRPRVLVIENTDFSTWEQQVLEADYTPVLYDGLNRYYVRNEEPDLMSRLSVPVNCLDDYIPHEYAERIAHLELALATAQTAVQTPTQPTIAAILPMTRIPSPIVIAPPPIAAKPVSAPITYEPVALPPLRVSGVPFYNHGDQPAQWYKWPIVAARRLLRRIQRPYFFAMQSQIDDLRNDLIEVREAAVILARRPINASVSEVAPISMTSTLPTLEIDYALDDLEWAARATRAISHVSHHPLRVLFAVSSGSQLYSGIGRAIFEVAKRTRSQIDYEFAIDDSNARNVEILGKFCREENFRLHIGQAGDGCGDPGNRSLPALLRRGGWDAVECVSFANSATNGAVLEHSGDLPIIYTPHYQPMWTIPATPEWSRQIDAVHNELLQRSAVVACDSPWEWHLLRDSAASGVDCALLPLGFDPAEFTVGRRDRRPYLLFVGDLIEKRKRFPLVLEVFAEVLRSCPSLQLVIVGNKSDQITSDIPDAIRQQCVLMGYVPETELRNLYREAAGLMQLSDYEAFGLPILEALACGTPVFLSRRPTVEGAFGRYKGTIFIDDDTPARMAEPIVGVLAKCNEFVGLALADRSRLEAELSWDVLAAKRVLAVKAALATRIAGHSRLAA